MKSFAKIAVIPAVLIAGCAQYSNQPTSFTLPTSNKSIDIVLHRSDVRFSDCGTLTVLQTYDASAKLIDSKEARGQAFHCTLIPALIEAGGRVGAGAVTGAARTTINNLNQQAQGQLQGQSQGQSQEQRARGGNARGGDSTIYPTQLIGPSEGSGNGHGNNGKGNGNGDGTNPGTDHHHDNGDNS